jgi:hypothetical protein
LDEQLSSTGHESVESDSSEAVGSFRNSFNPDSALQGYFSGENYSLDDFDLRTPAIPSTPNFDFHNDDLPADHGSYEIASSSLPAQRAPLSAPEGQFQCHVCLKTFPDKSKYRSVRTPVLKSNEN